MIRFYTTCIFCLLLAACTTEGKKKKKLSSPEGYDLATGEKLFLINRLEEISGIAFAPNDDTHLMAVNDEEGKLYPVDLQNSKGLYAPMKFSKSGDYEDLCFADGHWLVLQSNGTLLQLPTGDSINPDSTRKLKTLPKGSYEALFSSNDTVWSACKDCPTDADKTTLIYLMKAGGDTLQWLRTDTLYYSSALPKDRNVLQVSAMARHPLTGQWFILSHLSKRLLITNDRWQIEESYNLPRAIFTQPEGIAFSRNGDLYISSEGDENPGYIMQFRYTPKQP